MTAFQAARRTKCGQLLGALALTASLGLGGCSDVDEAMFGSDAENAPVAANTTPGTLPPDSGQAAPSEAAPSTVPSSAATPSAAAPSAATPDQSAGTLPDQTVEQSDTGAGPAPSSGPTDYNTYPTDQAADQAAGAQAALPPAPPSMMAGPVAVQPGSNTGTVVSGTIANLRSQLVALGDHLAQNTRRLADLHAQSARDDAAYHQAAAHITARLQVGTTRGNPELVAEWNTAQSSLDQVAANINQLSALGTDMTGDSASSRSLLAQIRATFNVSGQVDEDHRQLVVLEDETNQTIVLVEHRLKDMADDLRRQTAYAASERARLTRLANAIKDGDFNGGDMSHGGPVASYSGTGAALITIGFDRAKAAYQQDLYTALSEALKSQPSASFSVVAVTPVGGSAAAMHASQASAKRHAQDVVKSLTSMGVPASRLSVSSTTDPNLSRGEVRIYTR